MMEHGQILAKVRTNKSSRAYSKPRRAYSKFALEIDIHIGESGAIPDKILQTV
jgi:hypothetical protein